MILRWHVSVHYLTMHGINVVEHDIEEISDLETLIERGPDWNTIEKIEISLARKMFGQTITIEEARTL